MKQCYFLILLFFSISSPAQTTVFIGTTSAGGLHDSGVVYKINANGSGYAKLFDFNTSSGASPLGNLTLASNGKLFGTAMNAGQHGWGTAFYFDTATFTFNKIIDFSGTQGARPSGTLLNASDGKLYGTTRWGGAHNCGIIFSIDPITNVFNNVHDFDSINGKMPIGDLIQAANGILYGATSAGGNTNTGTIFSFDITTQSFTKLHDFMGQYDSNGGYPASGLMQASNGLLYGINSSSDSGSGWSGVMFSFDPATNIFSKTFDLKNAVDGVPSYYYPQNLFQAADGKIFATTMGGGSNYTLCCGTHPSIYYDGIIYSYDPTLNVSTKVYDFTNTNGKNPSGSLIESSNGKLYGTAGGGSTGNGVIFCYDYLAGTYSVLHNFSQTGGISPTGYLLQLNSNISGVQPNERPSIRIYPNPSTDFFSISSDKELGFVAIYDALGRLVFTEEIKNREYNVNFTKEEAGIYFVAIKGYRFKISKQ